MSSPYADDTGPEGKREFGSDAAPTAHDSTDREAQASSDGADPALAQPQTSASRPNRGGARGVNPQRQLAPSRRSECPAAQNAPAETAAGPSAFGPQSVSQLLSRGLAQALSDLTQSALQSYTGPFAGPDVVGDRSVPQAEPGWFESLTQDTTRDDPNTLISTLSNWFDNIQNAPVTAGVCQSFNKPVDGAGTHAGLSILLRRRHRWAT